MLKVKGERSEFILTLDFSKIVKYCCQQSLPLLLILPHGGCPKHGCDIVFGGSDLSFLSETFAYLT